jgi:hypothetical protein
MTPLTSKSALDAFFPEARAKVLDLAAILDRIGRGLGGTETSEDARMAKLRAALEVLLDPSPARAERVQQIFSLDYDPAWEKPKPRF